ncbi:MAG: hypothetical protein WBA87_13815 [Microbacterium sp.]
MTDHADAVRRRELQRRAFAAGGGLTGEEAEELRMLSAPAFGPAVVQASSVTAPEPAADAAPSSVAETTAASDALSTSDDALTASELLSASEPEATPEPAAAPARRPRRALAVIITVAALILGVGVGWLSSPPTVHAPPAMTSAQQKIDAEIVATGDFDAGSVRFRGEKDGAALWSATQKDKPCVILSVDGQRSIGCVSASRADSGIEYPVAQLQTPDGDKSTSYTAYLIPTLAGEWAPVLNSMQVIASDWKGQYTEAELKLIDILEKAGLHGSDLQILGYDGDIPIWSTWGPDRCIAVVDPDTSDVLQHCTDFEAESPLEITLGDSVYQAVWSDQRGMTLTILKQATATVVCNGETGECTSIDDTTGEIG